MNAATKFVAGHSDVMAGVLAVRGERYEHYMIAFFVYFKINMHSLVSYYKNVLTLLNHIAGFIYKNRLGEELYFLQNSEGAGLAPFDCWICLRGIKTMALRVERQQVSFIRILLEHMILFHLLYV